MLSTNVLCVKKRKKRYYCVSNISDGIATIKRDRSKNRLTNIEQHLGGRAAMIQVTEDTPPDMLTGAMDLTVHLPHGSAVKMSVNRSTPMMDLLVQVTTAHRLQPSAHIIQALGYAPNQIQSDVILPYKPNTPIGTLDTKHIKILPKSKFVNNKVLSSAGIGHRGSLQRGVSLTEQLPFESTFRLQVHLPRNQLYVTRVSQFVMLESIMKKVCAEKNLDEKKYEFRHPANLNEILDPKLTLSDYQLTEVSVVQRGKAVSASDMASLQREEERRRQQGRNGGGVFNLIFKRGKTGMGSGSVSSDTRSISPTRSDSSQSRSITPPAEPEIKPKIPARKRRPAPKPPVQQQNSNESIQEERIVPTNLTISHSRNSSDSSGYHEASILSDVQTLPRRNKLTASTNSINQSGVGATLPTHFEEKLKNGFGSAHSKSTSNLTLLGPKKKRAPPPPPTLKSSVSVCNLSSSPPVDPTPPTQVDAPAVPKPKPRTILPAQNTIEDTTSSTYSTLNRSEFSDTISIQSVKYSDDDDFDANDIIDFVNKQLKKCETEVPEPESAMGKTEETVFFEKVWHGKTFSSVPKFQETLSTTSLQSLESLPPYLEEKEGVGLRKWNTDVSDIAWVIGENGSDSGSVSSRQRISITTTPTIQEPTIEISEPPPETPESSPESPEPEIVPNIPEKQIPPKPTAIIALAPVEPPPEFTEPLSIETSDTVEVKSDLESDPEWQYQLPSPPTGFRDTNSPIESPMEPIPPSPPSEFSDVPKQLIHELQEVIAQPKPPKPTPKIEDYGTLPNFKLTTYNQPKRIHIFEDDSIRSGERESVRPEFPKKGITEREMNIINTMQNEFKKPVVVEIKKKSEFKKSQEILAEARRKSIERSDSFNGAGIVSSPVKRSKSHLSLNKYKNGVDEVRKTSSQWDISELQSLQVMRTILPKISNPPSPEREIEIESLQRTTTQQLELASKRISTELPVQNRQISIEPETKSNQRQIETVSRTQPTESIIKQKESIKIEPKRWSPPSVNFSTWSERPKSQVALKSDSDYIIGDATKLNQYQQKALQKPAEEPKYYRFQNIKRLPRPHSIAFESYQDLSHVPIVRAVELKKPEDRAATLTRNKSFSRENVIENNTQTLDRTQNSVLRNINKFNEFRSLNRFNPVVKGFRNSVPEERTQSTVTVNGHTVPPAVTVKTVPPPPMPPQLVKVSNRKVTKVIEDPRDQLLDAIRNFGKNNLRPIRR